LINLVSRKPSHNNISLFLLTTGIFFVLLNSGCKISDGFQIIKWGHDGTYLFAMESNNILLPGVHPIEKHSLFLLDSRFNKQAELLHNVFYISEEEMIPSPKSKRILVKVDQQMMVIDAISEETILRKEFNTGYPLHMGWHPSDSAVFYSDKKGIQLMGFIEQVPKLLIKGSFYGLDWTSDGNKLLYMSDRNVSSPRGNSLQVYDRITGKSSLVSQVFGGAYNQGFFSADGQIVFYGILKPDSMMIMKHNLETKAESVLWIFHEPLFSLRRVKESDKFLFSQRDIRTNVMLIQDSLHVRRLFECLNYDYHEGRDALVWINRKESEIHFDVLSNLKGKQK
jgi:hypothetical protein